MATHVRSYSKINLGLSIGSPRPDGFHELTTIYQTLALHDLVTVTARVTPGRASEISLTSNHPFVPPNAKNTAWRIVEAALMAMGISARVCIDIDKRLPVQGGLGGGSANAVAALVGLESELAKQGRGRQRGGRGFDDAARVRLAASIGSDVPLFLIGGTMLGLGRGEEVHPLPDLPVTECVIVSPGIGVSTPQAFADWDFLQAGVPNDEGSALTAAGQSDRVEGLSRSFAAVLVASAQGGPHSSGVFSWREGLAENPLLALVRTGIENDFERVVFPKYPLLGTIKRVLSGSAAAPGLDTGVPECAVGHAAMWAGLSGSGSALFGLYSSAEAAEAAVRRIEAFGLETRGVGAQGVKAFRTKTLPRQDYWSGMLIEA
ncbi:MAG TPA: 4-(cytidine 5'-diphospho)-2-C-methyl-D-erythritol kinase [Acidisarcina sp.]